MSVVNTEENQETVHEESAVCVGDGTTCVECGKVFTHPFYFSTHISTHTNQRGFVVVGQCALCGLVFSNADIFVAHLKSSESRLEKQMAKEDENEATETYPETNSEFTSKNDPVFENKSSEVQSKITVKQEVKINSPQPQSDKAQTESKEGISSINSSNNDEPRMKRKRKAPQRFEADSGPQFVPVQTDADPEVEAYLMSLKQMGLTVDPAAFSSHRGGKRRRKVSESGKGKVRKDIAWPGDGMDYSFDVVESQKKASPKYEYLDSDDSFEEEPEVLPESGKLTRGQRLQQRLERLSQAAEQGDANSSKKPVQIKLELQDDVSKDEGGKNTAVESKPHVDTHSKTNLPLTKLNMASAGAKSGQPIPGPGSVVKRENTTVAAPALVSNPYRAPPNSKATANSSSKNIVHRNVPQAHISKFNSVRAPGPRFVNKNNQYRAASMPSSSNLYQARSALATSNIRQRSSGFQLGKVKEVKGNTVGSSGTMNVNVEKSSSLEDLKKNSRENVEKMLQSIGMIAVTSSAMVQGKIFSSQKAKSGEISFPPVKTKGMFHQPNYPHRGFSSRPYSNPQMQSSQRAVSYRGQTKFWPKPVNGRGQPGSAANVTNKSPRGRQVANPHTFVSNTAGFSYSQTVERGRGASIHRGRGQNIHSVRGSVKGRSLNVAIRGKPRSVSSTAQPSTVNKGGASSTPKPTKPAQGSGDIIVIDDEEAPKDGAQRSSPGHRSTGKVAILDVDVDDVVSDIKIIEDRTQELSPMEPPMESKCSANSEKFSSHDDETVQDDENDIETEPDSAKPRQKRPKRKDKDSCTETAAELSQASNGNDPCTSKSSNESDNGDRKLKKDVTPEEKMEDIEGWKVSLAENSDSNEDEPSTSPRTSKVSAKEDSNLSPKGSPSETNSSPQLNEIVQEGPTQSDSLHENVSQISDIVHVSQGKSLDEAKMSHGSPDKVLNECLSPASEPILAKKSCSEEQNEAQRDISSSIACSDGKGMEMSTECEDTTQNHTELASYCPSQLSSCSAVAAQPESSSPSNVTLMVADNAIVCDVASEVTSESHPLTSITTGEAGAENPVGDKSIELDLVLTSSTQCVKDGTTDDQQELISPSRNSSSPLLLPPGDSVISDNERIDSDGGCTSSIEEDHSKNETLLEQKCLLNLEEHEVNSELAVSSNSSHVDQVECSQTPRTASRETSSNEEETYSEHVSENEADVKTKEIDGPAGDSESNSNAVRVDSSPSSDVPAAETVRSECETDSPASQTPAGVSADFLGDGNSLLDIFTEIEKTCKEMEKTLDKEKENQAVSQNQEKEVSRGLSDATDDSDESDKKGDNNEIVEGITENNEISGHEDGNDGEVKERSSEDGEHSEVIYENEMMEGGSITNIENETDDTKEIENQGLTKENCKTEDETEVKDICRDLPVTECGQEVRQTSEED